MRRRQMMQKVSRISLCVVIGLLFLALIWKFAGAQLAKKGIVLSNDTAAKTVSETAPEAEDGSGNAGIKKLAETTPPNETPGWQYSSSGWWYATDATTYYVNGWADIDGNQYHFDSNGYMATGWKAIGGKGCQYSPILKQYRMTHILCVVMVLKCCHAFIILPLLLLSC